MLVIDLHRYVQILCIFIGGNSARGMHSCTLIYYKIIKVRMTVRDSKVKKRPSLFDFVFSMWPSGLSFFVRV